MRIVDPVSTVMPMLNPRRARGFIGSLPPDAALALVPPEDRTGPDVHEERDDQEDESGLDEGRVLQRPGVLSVRGGDEARDGVAGGEEGGGEGEAAPDEEEHGHGLAEGPPEAEDRPPEDPGTGVGDDGEPGGLPFRRPEAEGRLALVDR